VIPVPVYFGRKFTVWIEDSVWQPVECEHCHIEWAFRVRVAGVGTGDSPYMLDDKGAKERAAKRARVGLEEDLRVASEGLTRNVACPGCGRYQSDMVKSLRAHYASSWGVLGAVSILLGCLLMLRCLTGDGAIGEAIVWLACGAVLLAGGVASLAWRRRLQGRFDPNATDAAGASGSPYRQSGDAALSANLELADGPDAITRAQYEAACTDAIAQGTKLRPILWRAAPKK
jgi:hypothetical protein